MSALLPRWFTIRRGQVIVAVLSAAIVPWSEARRLLLSAKCSPLTGPSTEILNDAAKFITFLSGYGYWLAPIASILLTDY